MAKAIMILGSVWRVMKSTWAGVPFWENQGNIS